VAARGMVGRAGTARRNRRARFELIFPAPPRLAIGSQVRPG
jgi:hypothetical protein